MTDRTRNLAILVLVGALLAAAAVVLATKPTKLGLDLKGGVELVYEAKPTKFTPEVTGDAIERSIDIMRERVDQLGVAEPEIQRSGNEQIIVSLPDVDNADEAERQVGTVAQLFFYDWEPNVIGPDGKTDPGNASVTGGPASGQVGAGCIPQYEAIERAQKATPNPDNNVSSGDKYYLVDPKAKKVIAGPDETEADLKASEAAQDAPTGATVEKVPEGIVLVQAERPENAQEDPDCWWVLQDDFALRGTDIKDPEQQFDNGPGGTGAPNVTFSFSDSGRDTWQQVTREIAQRGQNSFIGGDPSSAFQHFAIVLDNQLISTPYIDFQQNPDGIDGANGSEISGGFTIDTAQRLANLLKTGALPVELELISQSQVSATLGRQALNQGLAAALAGFAIVCLFLLAFYRILGAIAVFGLAIYAVYFYALIKLIPVTMTLPGIAGLVLTLGVAADANIVIFERIKEEIRAGRSVQAGIAQGYKKGLAAIIDANVVTFMTAFILFILATAGVKGFALTLGLGVVVSLFTAVLATQAVLGTMGRSKIIQSRSALGAGSDRKAPWHRYDFAGNSKYFFALSGVILLVCSLAIGAKGINFGIDFESGTRITAGFEKAVDENQLREVLAEDGLEAAKIQRITDNPELGDNAFQISAEELAPEQVTEITRDLDSAFGVRGSPDTQSIGPTFGETVANSAIVAIIASLLVISAYMALRFEWKYAVPVLIALMHDILITAGIYALVGQEVTTATVAALLTILGFSLYDTIIVFDRIRENVPRMPRAAFNQVVNRSMSEVLTRSLATSFATGLPIFALFIGGGETLQDFAFALLIGTISGTYSSVFIASQVLWHWKEREPMWVRRRLSIAAANGGVVPAYSDEGKLPDVEPQRKGSRRLTAPQDPSQGVSKEEFAEMVRELHVEEQPPSTGTPPPSTATPPPGTTQPDAGRDLTPDELVLKEDRRKQRQARRQQRNRKHGR